MAGYVQVNVKEMIEELGEDRVKTILADFICPKNKDVEDFLRNKAIEFMKNGFSGTYLVFVSYKNEPKLVGYYALANKTISVKRGILSKTFQKRLSRFGTYVSNSKRYTLAAILIGQLGKNYKDGIDKQITGDELLQMAFDTIKKIQIAIGGRFVFIECEDVERLKSFYSSNGFYEFGKRSLDREEIDMIRGEYLMQMIKYLNS